MALSTKVSILDKGEKDIFNVEYSNGRILRSDERDLEDFDVEEGTEVICDRAFANRDKLVNIYLPDSVKAIGESAFSGCRNLKEINIPEGVEEIKVNTFNGCNALEEITLPSTIKNIDKFAFDRGLKSLIILSPDAQIHRHAFLNCRNLETIKVPEGSSSFYQPQFKEANIKTNIEEIKLNDESIEEEINIEREDNKESNPDAEERTVTIVVTGRELEAILITDENESSDFSMGESLGMLVYDDYAEFTVYDGDEEEAYTIDDFEMEWEELEDPENPFPSNLKEEINIEKWVKENGGTGFKLYENKSQAQFEIQLKKGEEFDPSKAAIVPLNYIFRDDIDEPMMYKFLYDGKLYDFGPLESGGGRCMASYSLKFKR